LEKGQVVIMIHCGSRGLGHQVATDYIRLMSNVDGSALLDGSLRGGARFAGSSTDMTLVAPGLAGFAKVGLACAPIKSKVGMRYFGAMVCAANFAFANKQVITHFVRENLKHYFSDFKADVVYDVCHNIAKIERHEGRDVLVMRKGATRAFGPGRSEVPEDYRKVGQPVLLPGSMGTSSYVLVGTNDCGERAFGSCAHGAGRVMSRSESHKVLSFEDARIDLEKRGVFVEFGKKAGLVEEAPGSYKDIEEVLRVCDKGGLAKKVVSLRPVLVVIG